jgi:predicted transcriptional regulator
MTSIPKEQPEGRSSPAHQRWTYLRVADVMKDHIVRVPFSATVREIERMLIDNAVSGVAVTDNNDEIIGVVSWRDVMQYFAESPEREPHRPHEFFRYVEGDSSERVREVEIPVDDAAAASDIMSTDLLCIAADAGLGEVAGMMVQRKVHRLFVTEGPQGHIIGIVSTMDILNALSA